MIIDQLTEFTKNERADISRLSIQLSADIFISNKSFSSILEDDNFHLIVAKKEEKIIGMLSLILMDLISGKRGFIEDVVVDSSFRNLGVGENLIKRSIQVAKESGVTKLQLTSRPERIAANRLYQKLGFLKRETNCYQLIII